jgi:hypothetical protein
VDKLNEIDGKELIAGWKTIYWLQYCRIVTCRAERLQHQWAANWFVPVSWDLIVNK